MLILSRAALLGAQIGVLIFIPALVTGQTTAGSTTALDTFTQSGTGYTPTLVFDVATIKEAKNKDTSWMENPPQSSLFEGVNLTAAGLIRAAYHLTFSTLHGGPDWINTVRFDVDAKSEHSVDEALAKLSNQDGSLEKRHMLQVLLTERFNLKTHKETTMGRTYELVLGKPRSTFRQVVNPDESVRICGEIAYSRQGRRLVAEHCPLKALLYKLSEATGSPVVDKTGLAGSFAFTLQWNGKVDVASEVAKGDNTMDSWDPLLVAIRDQLGLILKPTTGPIESLIIDHIDKPSAN